MKTIDEDEVMSTLLEMRIDELEEKNAKLAAERDALAAQVEALKAAIVGVRKVGNKSGFGVQSPASVRAERLAWLRLGEVVELTPQQLLQEVKAQAGRKGYAQALFDQFAGDYRTLDNLKDKPDHYAESIRQGEVE